MATTTAIELAAEIEREVLSGDLQPGDQLLPVRAQADQRGIAPATVAAAYRRLRERGIVVGKARQGTRVAPRRVPAMAMVRPPVVPAGCVDAMTGNPDPSLLPSLGTALRALDHDRQVRYGDSLVDPGLAAAGRRWFEADGVDAANLTVTSGAMDAIERVIVAQGFRIGDRIGVEDPGHLPVHQLARSVGLELVPLPVDRGGVVPDGLETALAQGVAVVVITPRAQNPTGAALSPARAAALSQVLATRPEVMVIQDDHAGEVAGVGFAGLAPTGPRWAVVRSLAKAFGPDLRVAVLAGDAQTVDRVEVALSNGPGWVAQVLQRTAAHLLADDATSSLVERAATSDRERRTRLVDGLAARGVEAIGPSGLNVWVPVADEQAMVDAARSAGYAIRSGAPYRLAAPPAVRITVTHLSDRQLDEIAMALAAAARPSRPRRSTPQM